MVLTYVTVVAFGPVACFTQTLTGGLDPVRVRNPEAISYALRALLNHKLSPLPAAWVRGETRIEGGVLLEGEKYRVVLVPRGARDELCLRAYNGEGRDVTLRYRYLTDHCAEQDAAEVFDGRETRTELRVLGYDPEDDAHAEALAARTGGLSSLPSFRAYRRAFMRCFSPEPFREGKPYELVLGEGGRYEARVHGGGLAQSMSESERMLFRYLCFLRTAEFWSGFETLRNLHGIRKPLLVGGFLERLDAAIDVDALMARTRRLGRQVIVCTLPSEPRGLEEQGEQG